MEARSWKEDTLMKKTIDELEKEVLRLEAMVDVLKDVVRGECRTGARVVHPSQFTSKQHAVIQMLHEGMGTEAMAETLETSTATLKGHIKSISASLGVHRREEIIEATREMLAGDAQEYLKHAGLDVGWARSGAPAPERLKVKVRRQHHAQGEEKGPSAVGGGDAAGSAGAEEHRAAGRKRERG